MKANHAFTRRSSQFWGYVRLIGDKLGYSKNGYIKTFDEETVLKLMQTLDARIDPDMLEDVLQYIEFRADMLENQVRVNLMNSEEAKEVFKDFSLHHRNNNFSCKLPMNKQSGDKKAVAFLTGLVNVSTEHTLRYLASKHNLSYEKDLMFDDDPRNLTYLKDQYSYIQGAMSRRYDGAFPSIVNPRAIWEIKEYYYTTTFGSRIADGVYETQLDGHEINELAHLVEGDIKHIYFIDSYNTWWVQGKSYLCRIVDMLHMGLVDEVIVGKEVIDYWPHVLTEIVEDHLIKTGRI